MKTFEEFKQEVREKAREYAAQLTEEHKTGFEVMGASTTALYLHVFDIDIVPVERKKRYLKEHFSYVYDTQQECFVKAKVTARRVTPHKRQPKNPITLDNYEFYDSEMGLKGIHKKPVSYANIGCSQVSSGGTVIARGRTFTDDEYARAKELVNGGMDFFEAADQVGAAS